MKPPLSPGHQCRRRDSFMRNKAQLHAALDRSYFGGGGRWLMLIDFFDAHFCHYALPKRPEGDDTTRRLHGHFEKFVAYIFAMLSWLR